MGGSAVALPPMLQNGWVGGERKTFEKPCASLETELTRVSGYGSIYLTG